MGAPTHRAFWAFPLFGSIFLLAFACLPGRPDHCWIGSSVPIPTPAPGPALVTRGHSQAPRTPDFEPAIAFTPLANRTLHQKVEKVTEGAARASSPPLKPSLPASAQLLQGHIFFERNDGQADREVLYLSHGSGYSLFLTRTGATIVLPGAQKKGLGAASHARFFRLRFGGANSQIEVTGVEALPGSSNYFSGSDPRLWHTRIPQFAKVRYANLYPGIDLIFYFREGQLEYDLIVSPGANLDAVNLQIEGANASLTRDGDVAIKMGANELVRFRKPYAYQSGATATVVPTSYSLHHAKLSFALGHYDRSRALVIDPALIFATFITSNCPTCADNIGDIAADNTGVYLTGSTDAAVFPATANGSAPSKTQNYQTFIVKLDPTGSHILYSTFLSNSGGAAITVDGQGSAYVTGGTSFPPTAGISAFPLTTGVFSDTVPPNPSGGVGYATKLSADGSTILYSTLLQQPTTDGTTNSNPQSLNISKIAVDSTGALYVTGLAQFDTAFRTTSTWMGLPVTLGAFQTTPGSAYVLKLNPDASGLAYATYFDGTGNMPGESVVGIGIDSSGDAFVAGSTSGGTFPTTPGAYQSTSPTDPSYSSGFVTELNPTGTAPVYSTFFGTTGDTNTVTSGLAVDPSGRAVITGYSIGSLPTTSNAFCGNFTPPPSPIDGFVAKLTANGSGVVYATTLCGSYSYATSVAVDSTGAAYVVGMTDYPATFQPILLQPIEGYFSNLPDLVNVALKLDTSGNLQWSTFLGLNYAGSSNSRIAVDGTGAAYVLANSDILPTPNSLGPLSPNPGAGGNEDSPNFLLKIAPSLGAPVPIVSPRQVSFTNQNVGVASAPVDVQAGNFGDAPMSPGVSITGDFSETDNCSVAVPGGQKCDINVTFTPSVTGPRTGVLTVTFGGSIASQTVALSGNAGAPAVSLSPTSLSFGVQATGTTSGAQQVLVTNIGTGPLTISSLQTSGPFATTNTCGARVAPASDCTIQVTFTPTASGTQTGMLTITDNAPNSPETVTLTGGVPPQASASLSPSSLSFTSQQVGTTSSAQIVTLANTGTLALQISNIQIAAPFSQSNTCGSSLAAGASCPISVTFAPTAAGAATGTLTVTDNATGSPQTVSVTGTGTGAAPTIGLGLASGGSASATVTAGATATYALSIGGAGMAGTASLACSGAPTGATCSVPASVSLSATTASPFNVSVPTTARSHVWLFPTGPTPWLWALAILGCLVLIKAASLQQSPRLRWRLAPLLALALCPCGGGSSTPTPTPTPNPNGTPAGAYTIVVTAKSGTTTQTQNLTLTVQ